MAFRIDITEPALADAEEYVRFIRETRNEPEAAERWFHGLAQAIFSLEDLPERCPVIPEQEEFSFEIRHLRSKPKNTFALQCATERPEQNR